MTTFFFDDFVPDDMSSFHSSNVELLIPFTTKFKEWLAVEYLVAPSLRSNLALSESVVGSYSRKQDQSESVEEEEENDQSSFASESTHTLVKMDYEGGGFWSKRLQFPSACLERACYRYITLCSRGKVQRTEDINSYRSLQDSLPPNMMIHGRLLIMDYWRDQPSHVDRIWYSRTFRSSLDQYLPQSAIGCGSQRGAKEVDSKVRKEVLHPLSSDLMPLELSSYSSPLLSSFLINRLNRESSSSSGQEISSAHKLQSVTYVDNGEIKDLRSCPDETIVRVHFNIRIKCLDCKLFHLRISGSCDELGNWDPFDSPVCQRRPPSFRHFYASLPIRKSVLLSQRGLSFKFVLTEKSRLHSQSTPLRQNAVIWEDGDNRSLNFDDSFFDLSHVVLNNLEFRKSPECIFRLISVMVDISKLSRSLHVPSNELASSPSSPSVHQAVGESPPLFSKTCAGEIEDGIRLLPWISRCGIRTFCLKNICFFKNPKQAFQFPAINPNVISVEEVIRYWFEDEEEQHVLLQHYYQDYQSLVIRFNKEPDTSQVAYTLDEESLKELLQLKTSFLRRVWSLSCQPRPVASTASLKMSDFRGFIKDNRWWIDEIWSRHQAELALAAIETKEEFAFCQFNVHRQLQELHQSSEQNNITLMYQLDLSFITEQSSASVSSSTQVTSLFQQPSCEEEKRWLAVLHLLNQTFKSYYMSLPESLPENLEDFKGFLRLISNASECLIIVEENRSLDFEEISDYIIVLHPLCASKNYERQEQPSLDGGKNFNCSFPGSLPFSSACATSGLSTTLGEWWSEDKKRRDFFASRVLNEPYAPDSLEPWVVRKVIQILFKSPSCLVFLKLTEILGLRFFREIGLGKVQKSQGLVELLDSDPFSLCPDFFEMALWSGRK